MKSLYLLVPLAPLAGAIVAAIALTLRRRKETKYQNPSEQLAVKPGERLKIVKNMTSGAK